MLVIYRSRRQRHLKIGLGLVSVHLTMVNSRGDLDGVQMMIMIDSTDDDDDTNSSNTSRNSNSR